MYIFALYKAHFKFSSERSYEGTNLASGTLSLSFGLHNVETNVFLLLLLLCLFDCFFFSEVQSIVISAFNALMS